jgi:hypothetical protein
MITQGEPWVIICDAQLTRRKRYHAVLDPAGVERLKSRILWDCIAYLDAEGVTRYQLVAGALDEADPSAMRWVSKE